MKCEKAGTCAETNEKCEEIYANTLLPNKCSLASPIQCADGSCVAGKSLCATQSSCPNETPVKCIDSSCAKTVEACLTVSLICDQDQVQCPDKTCKSSYSECHLLNGCPVARPYKCADSSCAEVPFGQNGCALTINCPSYKPFLCSDGECVGDQAHCRVQQPCDAQSPIRCPDMSCAKSTSDCSAITRCPITAPVLCDSGLCVKSIQQCKQAKFMYCPLYKPVMCVNGECKAFPEQCQSSYEGTAARRLLSESAVDDGCSESYPSKCYDGSCRKLSSECEKIPGCFDPSLPFRCRSGVCARNVHSCEDDASLKDCPEGQTRCEDGICRQLCPAYLGCPKQRPFFCPNGLCGESAADCAGHSGCPINTPFRCANNSCVPNIVDCKRAINTFQPQLQNTFTVAQLSNQKFDIIQPDGSSIVYGKMEIPAGALLEPLSPSRRLLEDQVSDSSQMQINAVPTSEVENTATEISNEMKAYVQEFFPYSDGKLDYHEAVRSPVIETSVPDRDNAVPYRFPIELTFLVEIPQNANKTNDFCLGKLDKLNGMWQCATRLQLLKDEQDNSITYPVYYDGIYAVIFNPDRIHEDTPAAPCFFFCQNKETIIYTFIGLFVAGIILSYIFWRLNRYVQKYREAKTMMDDYKE